MISALIITFNRRSHICRAIDSILAQSAAVDEIVVIDDGSTDGTEELLRTTYGPKIRYVRQQNRGVSGARRRAIDEARGEWIAFLDSDDEWTPDRNREFLSMLKGLPSDVAWVFGDTEVLRDDGASASVYETYARGMDHGPRIIEDAMSVQTPFQLGLIQSSLYRRAALLSVDCFSENLNHSEDFLVGVQVACAYRVAMIRNVVTRLYRTSDLTASSQDAGHRNGPDYSRARMIAFRSIVETGRKSPYGAWYGESARSLLQINSSLGKSTRGLLREQFRYGVTPKAILFSIAAAFGRSGIKMWNSVSEALQQRGRSNTNAPSSSPSLV
jgi:glycosyltransferase involved in cell wall biosynthesis